MIVLKSGASINTTAILKPPRNGVNDTEALSNVYVCICVYNMLFARRQRSLPIYVLQHAILCVKRNKTKIKSRITSLCQSNCVELAN